MSNESDSLGCEIAGAIAFFILLWFFISFPIIFFILLSLLVLGLLAWLFWRYCTKTGRESAKRKAEERKLKAKEKWKEEEEKWKEKEKEKEETGYWLFKEDGQSTENRAATINVLENIFHSPVLIDTNIWMGDFDDFWKDILKMCQESGRKISIPSAVHDEIVRLKSGNDENKKYWARVALRRVLEFSNKKCIDIVDIKKSSNPAAYADPEIITLCGKLIDKKIANKISASIITNDVDLIIRARHLLNRDDNIRCRILSVELTKFAKQKKIRSQPH